jgi:hypothetical protein
MPRRRDTFRVTRESLAATGESPTRRSESPPAITIRPAYPDDEAAIVRLAALDSAAVPSSPFLVAEVGGELRAALSLGSGRVIADPFHQTLRIVEMLRAYSGAEAPDARSNRARYRPGLLALGY